MEIWYWFWITCLAVAGTSFALIALVVSYRGVDDLRQMLADLRRENPTEDGK